MISVDQLLVLIAGFVVGGLREIGEPARKAMTSTWCSRRSAGDPIGLYYLIRSLAISPAAFIGGLLWNVCACGAFRRRGRHRRNRNRGLRGDGGGTLRELNHVVVLCGRNPARHIRGG